MPVEYGALALALVPPGAVRPADNSRGVEVWNGACTGPAECRGTDAGGVALRGVSLANGAELGPGDGGLSLFSGVKTPGSDGFDETARRWIPCTTEMGKELGSSTERGPPAGAELMRFRRCRRAASGVVAEEPPDGAAA